MLVVRVPAPSPQWRGSEAASTAWTEGESHHAVAGGRPWVALPLSHSEVPRRAAAEVAAFRVGAAIAARVVGGGALVHVVAGAGELVEGEARGAGALVTAQGVVAGRRATGAGVGTFVLICWKEESKSYTGKGRGRGR